MLFQEDVKYDNIVLNASDDLKLYLIRLDKFDRSVYVFETRSLNGKTRLKYKTRSKGFI